MLSYRSHDMSGIWVLTAEKTAGEEAPPSQRDGIYRTIESSTPPRFAVDLGQIDYMSSAEIGFLIALKRRIDGRGGKFVLCQADPFILEVLRTMRLDTFFLIADDLTQAIAQLTD